MGRGLHFSHHYKKSIPDSLCPYSLSPEGVCGLDPQREAEPLSQRYHSQFAIDLQTSERENKC